MKFSMNLNVPTKLDFKLSSWFIWEAQQILLLQSFDCNIASIRVCWQIVQEECFATLKCQDFKEYSTFKVFCGLDFLRKIKYSNQNVWFIFWCWMCCEWIVILGTQCKYRQVELRTQMRYKCSKSTIDSPWNPQWISNKSNSVL